MERLKVVHIIQSLQTGGAEKLLLYLAVNSRERFDVSVISQYSERDLPYEKYLKEQGIKIIYLNKKPGFDICSLIMLYKTLNRLNPDIVHTHLHAAAYAVPWYITHVKTIKVHTVHSIAPQEFGIIHRLVQGFAYRFLGVVPVAISSSIKRTIIKQYGISEKKIPVIFNGVNISKYAMPEKAKTPSPYFTFINVASFSKWKNQMLLLNSFYRASLKYPDMQLIFVGDGIEKEKIKNKAEELGVMNKIFFTGITNNVESFLSRADVFVLSSTFEGLPLSILEAYAAGLPVISTNVGGVPDILKDGVNGFLVPSNDEIAMENALLRIYENPKQRDEMGSINRLIANEFDIKKVTEKYTELYSRYGEKHE
jgi:glycosyltransferase involved in cell wall biosynthesis